MRQKLCRATLLSSFFALTPALASAQVTTIFHEGFETGLDDWTVSSGGNSEWHLEFDTSPCASEAAPFPVGNAVARFGSSGCVFGATPGHLTRTAPISIPAGTGPVTLRIVSYDDTECASCEWDWRFIYVSADGGVTWDQVGESAELFWHETVMDLTPYSGMDINLRFTFDAVDEFGNHGLGWLIDDVRIDVCEPPLNYCSATPNSSGAAGQIFLAGSTSVTANDMILRSGNCPPGQIGLFIYGATQASNPVGDGVLCLAAPTYRLNPLATINSFGRASHALDFGAAPLNSGAGATLPGSTWNFTFGFRDPQGGSAGFNFTDGIEVNFCP